jgi:hypothetical protein
MHVLWQILLAILVADFGSGLLHWFEDTYIHYCTRVPFFKDIAQDNEMHHYYPRSIVYKSYVENM